MCTPLNQTYSQDITTQQYGRAIQQSSAALKLPQYSGHSARAGFVSDAALSGKTIDQIIAVTRHASVASLKVYLDVVAHMNQVHKGPLTKWIPVAQHIKREPWLYFPQLSYSGAVYDIRKFI